MDIYFVCNLLAGVLIGLSLYEKCCVKKKTDEIDMPYTDSEKAEDTKKYHRLLKELWYGSPVTFTKTTKGNTTSWTMQSGKD